MLRLVRFAAVVLVLGAILFLIVETRRLAELAGGFEAEARTARAAAQVAAAERDTVRADADRLAGELRAAQQQLQAVSDVVDQRSEALRRAAERAEAEAAASLRAMPEGVRLCLQTLHECLRGEGFTAQRFLSARALDEHGLHDVELLDLQSDGLGAAFVRAGRMQAALDRGTGRLELRFFDGQRTQDGERTALPADGFALVFAPVDGRVFERRLPYLIDASGAYPDEAPAGSTADVDPLTRRRWLERFDALLGTAGAVEQLQVTRFRGMQDGWFLDAEVIGTDARHHVVSMAFAQRLCVELDAAAGVVSLRLVDGNLRRGGVDSTISAEGYRMLLPNVTIQKAADLMLGMVVRK
ncbi:MAG: hypothetical protein JNL08_02115 [Planctomycetes bacterium]|nr:hypothetical protein [Planctomycetota bacterium]